MSSHSDSDDKSNTIGLMDAQNGKYCSTNLKLLDDMICWWKTHKPTIHMNPDVVAKYDRIILQLKNYREDVSDKINTSKCYARLARDLHESHICKNSKFMAAEKQANDAQRELCQTLDDSGHYIQALITKWFLEGDYFKIEDLEVKGVGYDFDIEVTDKHGNKYNIEVWYGQSKLNHAIRESTTIIRGCQETIHSDPGSVPDRFNGVVSDHGSVSLDSNHDLPKVWKKLDQLRNDHVGFLIACRPRNSSLMGFKSDFPIVPQKCIPPNKCIVVLDFDGGSAFGERGAGYVVHHPNFAHIEVAKKIIQILGFRYDPDRYTEKVQTLKQFNLL